MSFDLDSRFQGVLFALPTLESDTVERPCDYSSLLFADVAALDVMTVLVNNTGKNQS